MFHANRQGNHGAIAEPPLKNPCQAPKQTALDQGRSFNKSNAKVWSNAAMKMYLGPNRLRIFARTSPRASILKWGSCLIHRVNQSGSCLTHPSTQGGTLGVGSPFFSTILLFVHQIRFPFSGSGFLEVFYRHRSPFGKIDGPGKWNKPHLNQGPLCFKQTNLIYIYI